ncbi:hypothetical protein [Synechococcus phage Yong-M2-251]|nr:hypothetical protein [Synechococcus phage Yong-M2-251]
MKSRTCCSVSGQMRPPALNRSTSRPLFAARMPKRCSPMFSETMKFSISDNRSLRISTQYTRYRVQYNTRNNVRAEKMLAWYP